jgi:hypothetical protein
VDQNIAGFLGLDLTNPETIALIAEQDEITAIRRRVWDVLARTGTSEEQLSELINVDPAKLAASLAGDRRFSTYELAAIATHGGVTVEWLCADDEQPSDDCPPEVTEGLARLVGRADVFATPTPDRDGYTIAVYLPPGVTETDRDRLYDAIADAAHHGDGWDVVGVPGDPMGIGSAPEGSRSGDASHELPDSSPFRLDEAVR